jgi:HlyD family secretion protein
MDKFLSWFAGLFAAIGLGGTPALVWSGYVEADYVYVSPVAAGQIESIAVAEGQLVRRGDVLFVLRSDQQQAQLRNAEAQVAAAEATWQNLTTGARPEELVAAAAAVTRAQTDFDLAQSTLVRTQQLFAGNNVPRAQLDRDSATAATALAALDQAKAQRDVLSLPARQEQQNAARAALEAARAGADQARAALADRTITAPQDGKVDRLFFSAGETAAAGTPVVSLLPADALKVKFYVGEAERHQLQPGAGVAVACDGCGGDLVARVSYLDSQPQNTPPIIYSRDERNRLVFMIEAKLPDGAALLPGQPVTVTP